MLHDLEAAGDNRQLSRVRRQLINDLLPQHAQAELLARDKTLHHVGGRQALREPPGRMLVEVGQAELVGCGEVQNVLVDLRRGRLVCPLGAGAHTIHVAEHNADCLCCRNADDLELPALALHKLRHLRRGGSLNWRLHRRWTLRSRRCWHHRRWSGSTLGGGRDRHTWVGRRHLRRGRRYLGCGRCGRGLGRCRLGLLRDEEREKALHGIALHGLSILRHEPQEFAKVVAHRRQHGLVCWKALAAAHESHVAQLTLGIQRPEAFREHSGTILLGLHVDFDAHCHNACRHLLAFLWRSHPEKEGQLYASRGERCRILA
mmetsp:Transcript_71450/g.201725  ORF Transcript_71450/g.201725 Transcript_71450/m.201725 type:complete len:317 (-) Transcript_71450:21-971(-)